MRQSIEIDPRNADYRSNLASLLRRLGRSTGSRTLTIAKR